MLVVLRQFLQRIAFHNLTLTNNDLDTTYETT